MILKIQELIENYNYPNEGFIVDIDIEGYIKKLLEKAVILTFYENNLGAFIAFYANDTKSNIGFLSMLIVDSELQGKGLGYMLYKQSEDYLKQRGFTIYQLEVNRKNSNVLNFYIGLGFYVISIKSNFIKMQKDL